MANLANYSPYNKTFKFICFQNSAYHEANKQRMKPMVRTNLRRRLSVNPELGMSSGPSFLKDFSRRDESEDMAASAAQRHSLRNLSMSQLSVKSVVEKPPLVVHKNASFDKFEKWRISRENKSLVKRLLDTNCQVITNKKSAKSFEKHLKYRDIRKLYNSKHVHKQQLVIPNAELLCPTLSCHHSRNGSVILNESNVFSSYSEMQRPETTRTTATKRKNIY